MRGMARHGLGRLLLVLAILAGTTFLAGGEASAHAAPDVRLAIDTDGTVEPEPERVSEAEECHPDPGCHGAMGALAAPAEPGMTDALGRKIVPPARGRTGVSPTRDPPIPIALL